MALERYKAKRKFGKTPEPTGGERKGRGPLRFVVQKHAASHLHYDLRLELDGVLKSWAVPKGPSLNPEDKRLAMMVEDHPLDYRTFEGTIPKGNYGAGEVIVWDEGFYGVPGFEKREETEEAAGKGLAKGDFKIVLYGEKLKGEFVLAKIKGKEDNAWLLIKKKDRYASLRDVRADDRSVRSGRRLPDKPAAARSGRAALTTAPAARISRKVREEMPRNVKPMLAVLAEEPFDGENWFFEMKWDGFRAIAEIPAEGEPKIYSRNNLPLGERFPVITEELHGLPKESVFDGEIVAVDEKGISRFQYLQNHHRNAEGELRYYVFDLLYWAGRDLRGLPLRQRKDILREVLPQSRHIKYSDHVEKAGKAFYEEAKRMSLEGIIAKNAESPYRDGRRSPDWKKIKILNQQEAVIAGFTEPKGSRKKIGALVLGVYEGKDLVYIGHAGGGLDEASLDEIHGKLIKIARKETPFRIKPKTNMPVTWVEPKLVCQVKFQEWTEGGNMRQPIFLGLRPDKKPEEVRREPAAKKKATEELSGGVLIGEHVVEISNPDKVYWPKENYSKRDLISYYREVAEAIIPHLKDRPENMNRHPNGIEGESFYQKNVDHMPPDWVKVEEIYSESNRKNIRYLVCQDEATLVYMANLGCIELNPWLSRTGSLERPDFALFDLDPEKIGFGAVVEAAGEVRRIFEELEVESYVKTSGATGLHIAVPLGAKYEYEQAKQFAEIIMRMVNRKLPKTTSLERSPAKRQGKVYLDYLQNRKGQTMAAAYCVRPKPGAPVSAPLEWKEVRRGLDPAKFNMRTMPKRLEKKGDLWESLLTHPGIEIMRTLEKMK